MSRVSSPLDERCASALRRHLVAGDESTLNEAYEFGRTALADGVGVLNMASALWRAVLGLPGVTVEQSLPPRVGAFLLECLAPFEMAHRGAREANEALRRLDQRREEQVRRIVRELHDEATQLLATVHLALDGLRPHLESGGERRLEEAIGLLRRTEDEIRRLSHELRPILLDDLGLLPTLQFLAQRVTQRSGIAVEVLGSTGGRLPPHVETALYRAAQEALGNVARHAGASRATLAVERAEREVVCRIRDNGRGFDTAATLASGAPRGLGLDGMRERIAPLGGTLGIHSRPGSGTEVTIRVPLEVRYAGSTADRG